jgi:hypothetical protein
MPMVSGDSGQRQDRAKARQCANQQHAIQRQGERCIDTGPTVLNEHRRNYR